MNTQSKMLSAALAAVLFSTAPAFAQDSGTGTETTETEVTETSSVPKARLVDRIGQLVGIDFGDDIEGGHGLSRACGRGAQVSACAHIACASSQVSTVLERALNRSLRKPCRVLCDRARMPQLHPPAASLFR